MENEGLLASIWKLDQEEEKVVFAASQPHSDAEGRREGETCVWSMVTAGNKRNHSDMGVGGGCKKPLQSKPFYGLLL